MSELHIVCQNCGAKYKLPESFQGAKAKCKACGAAIDVAAQRSGAAAPAPSAPSSTPSAAAPANAKARPAAARPAEARAAEPRPAAEPRRAARKTEASGASPTRAGRRGAAAGTEEPADEGKPGRARRGSREKPEKKGGMSPAAIGGILGGVAVLVVGGIFLFGGGDDDTTKTDTANAPAGQSGENPANPVKPQAGPEGAAQTPAAKQAGTEPVTPPTPEPAAVGTATDAAATTPPADKPSETKPAEPKPAEPKPKPKAAERVINSKAEVFDPKTLEELAWPEEVPQAKRDEITALIADIADGGRPGINAKRKLEEIGWASLFGLVNHLRTFDYTSGPATLDAGEINLLLEAITDGTNAGFRPLQADEPTLQDMDWNARTVQAWQRFVNAFPTEEKFKARQKSKDASRKDG